MKTGIGNARVSVVLLTVLTAVLAASVLAAVVSSTAEAAFPGTNGKIAFESVFDTWVKNASPSSPETKLLDGAWDVAYSPDGSRIAFVRESPGPEILGAPDSKIAFGHGGRLWTMLADGSAKDELSYTCPTENGGICDNVIGTPTFSPDGARIAANYYGDIFTVPSGGGTSTLLLQGPESGQPLAEQHATWSPDGASIAFQANPRSGGQSAIYVAPAGGTTDPPTMITSNAPGDVEPEWQPTSPTCNINGNANANILNGTTDDDTICGLGGNDTINGGGGDDIVMGGDGNDTLVAESDRTTLNGGAGSDTASFAGSATPIEASLLTGFAQRAGTEPIEGAALVGIEGLTGSSLGDTLTGSNTANKLVGGGGADELLGSGGKDRINSRDGIKNDTVNGGPGTDTCTTDPREISIRSCE